ncbi:MAG: tetratricopeptide repeat protein [Geobacteraceae bacterium]
MSTKKEKYLESAQKSIIKGQIDRAIKDYEQVVALDSNDMRHRQRLAELLVRVNRKNDAVAEYEAIGRHYADNAYYLKAIAVYKQIQKLTPNELKISLTLASLNEKQGLIGNALAEYGLVCKEYEKIGDTKELLAILEKMLAIDPQNPATLLKFAEIHYALGQLDKAYEEFTSLALLLRKRKDETAFDRISGRIQQLFPDKCEFILDLLAAQIEKGETSEAISRLQGIIRNDNPNLKAWRLLIRAYQSLRETENLKLTYHLMSGIFHDDAVVLEGMVRCALDEGNAEEAVELLTSYAPHFIVDGNKESAEHLYLALLELAPDDTRALDGLAKLYEATSASAKLAKVRARLADLSLEKNSHTGSPTAAPDISVNPVTPLIDAPEQQEGTVDWEEDIDLALLEETAPIEPEPLAANDYGTGADAIPNASGNETQSGENAAAPTADEGAIPLDEATLQADVELDNDFLGTDWLDEAYEEPAFAGEENEEGALPTVDELSTPDPSLPGSADGELFNLGNEELPAEVPVEEPLTTVPHDKYSTDGLVTSFNKGLEQQVDEGDTETHYNLGIAYMEMGLMDEAINEFQSAVVDPHRKLDCLTLQGVCYRDKGDMETAEQVFQAVIEMDGITPEGILSLKYELALLYEATGRKDEALLTYLDIQAVMSGFRDTQQKLVELMGKEAAGKLEELELLDELECEESEPER